MACLQTCLPWDRDWQHNKFLVGEPAPLILLPMALQRHHSVWGAQLLLEAQALLTALPATLAARASLEALWLAFAADSAVWADPALLCRRCCGVVL